MYSNFTIFQNKTYGYEKRVKEFSSPTSSQIISTNEKYFDNNKTDQVEELFPNLKKLSVKFGIELYSILAELDYETVDILNIEQAAFEIFNNYKLVKRSQIAKKILLTINNNFSGLPSVINCLFQILVQKLDKNLSLNETLTCNTENETEKEIKKRQQKYIKINPKCYNPEKRLISLHENLPFLSYETFGDTITEKSIELKLTTAVKLILEVIVIEILKEYETENNNQLENNHNDNTNNQTEKENCFEGKSQFSVSKEILPNSTSCQFCF